MIEGRRREREGEGRRREREEEFLEENLKFMREESLLVGRIWKLGS